jgi:hypothetical protein
MDEKKAYRSLITLIFHSRKALISIENPPYDKYMVGSRCCTNFRSLVLVCAGTSAKIQAERRSRSFTSERLGKMHSYWRLVSRDASPSHHFRQLTTSITHKSPSQPVRLHHRHIFSEVINQLDHYGKEKERSPRCGGDSSAAVVLLL